MTIADVSGKGVPAALFMSVSKTMIKNRTKVGGTPAEILNDVNKWLCEGNDNMMFVTVWHVILTVSTGELICANAGHECPVVRMGEKSFEILKTEHGPMMGVIEDLNYVDERLTLSSGDVIFVYTDGVPEANTADDKMFGMDRLKTVLDGTVNETIPETIIRIVKSAVDDFADGAPQYDDVTMLCLVMK